MSDLQEFVDAQDTVMNEVYAELTEGKKCSHWMWFVFPQLAALERSPNAIKYGIESIEQASGPNPLPQAQT
jgi:uncharacterized protein (DUF1810 family)